MENTAVFMQYAVHTGTWKMHMRLPNQERYTTRSKNQNIQREKRCPSTDTLSLVLTGINTVPKCVSVPVFGYSQTIGHVVIGTMRRVPC